MNKCPPFVQILGSVPTMVTHLDPPEIAALTQVCRASRDLFGKPGVWREVFERQVGLPQGTLAPCARLTRVRNRDFHPFFHPSFSWRKMSLGTWSLYHRPPQGGHTERYLQQPTPQPWQCPSSYAYSTLLMRRGPPIETLCRLWYRHNIYEFNADIMRTDASASEKAMEDAMANGLLFGAGAVVFAAGTFSDIPTIAILNGSAACIVGAWRQWVVFSCAKAEANTLRAKEQGLRQAQQSTKQDLRLAMGRLGRELFFP